MGRMTILNTRFWGKNVFSCIENMVISSKQVIINMTARGVVVGFHRFSLDDIYEIENDKIHNEL